MTTFFFGLRKINKLRSKYLHNCGSWARWALAIKESNKWYILDGGKKINVSGLFVDYPVLSPDGKSLLFSAKTGNEITIYQNYQVLAKWKDLCDLNSGTAYISPEDSPPLLMISSSANRIAYCARDNKNESFLVVDGKKYSTHSMVSIFLFSPTGKRWAAVVQRGESGEEGTREKIVVDGIEGEWESWASIRDIVFDSLRDHIAYSMKTGETRKVLLQQKLLANFSDDAEEVLFEPSGKLCILSKTKEHKYRIWCGGKHGELWDSVETFSSSIFAIDGYMNYVAHKQGDVYVVRRKISE